MKAVINIEYISGDDEYRIMDMFQALMAEDGDKIELMDDYTEPLYVCLDEEYRKVDPDGTVHHIEADEWVEGE